MGFIASVTAITLSSAIGRRIEAWYVHRNRIATPPPSSIDISLFGLYQNLCEAASNKRRMKDIHKLQTLDTFKTFLDSQRADVDFCLTTNDIKVKGNDGIFPVKREKCFCTNRCRMMYSEQGKNSLRFQECF